MQTATRCLFRPSIREHFCPLGTRAESTRSVPAPGSSQCPCGDTVGRRASGGSIGATKGMLSPGKLVEPGPEKAKAEGITRTHAGTEKAKRRAGSTLPRTPAQKYCMHSDKSCWVGGRLAERAEAVAREALSRAQKSKIIAPSANSLAILGQIAQGSGNLDKAQATFFVESAASMPGWEGLQHCEVLRMRNTCGTGTHAGRPCPCDHAVRRKLVVVRTMGMTFGVALIMTHAFSATCSRQPAELHSAQKRATGKASTLLRAFRQPHLYIAWCLEGFAAALNAEMVSMLQATRLCSAAVTAMRKQAQTPLPPSERDAFEQTIANSKNSSLASLPLERSETIGAEFTTNQSIDYALSDACA